MIAVWIDHQDPLNELHGLGEVRLRRPFTDSEKWLRVLSNEVLHDYGHLAKLLQAETTIDIIVISGCDEDHPRQQLP